MPEIRELLAHNLSLLLSERNITQKQLADDMNVSEGAVAHWIKGDNAPSIQRVVDICIKYGVSFDKMFFTYMQTTIRRCIMYFCYTVHIVLYSNVVYNI